MKEHQYMDHACRVYGAFRGVVHMPTDELRMYEVDYLSFKSRRINGLNEVYGPSKESTSHCAFCSTKPLTAGEVDKNA